MWVHRISRFSHSLAKTSKLNAPRTISRQIGPVGVCTQKPCPGQVWPGHGPSLGHSGAARRAEPGIQLQGKFLRYWIPDRRYAASGMTGGETYGTRMVDPVVLRPSRSWCAFTASLSLYFWLIGIFTLPLPTTSNRFLAISSRSARLAA